MNILDVITAKKNKQILTQQQITFFVRGVMTGSVPDYQISALLMAICINGMTEKETFFLTQALAESGEKADLSSVLGTVVDKHSTGGIGDKCTIIIGPIVSSFGVPFLKLSGRGLGYTGGTKDKLESIRGFRMDLDSNEMISRVHEIGIAISSQNTKLAPADKRLYEIRDVTATTESIPLIAASIMSKKIASGAKSLVLDVKCGNGAFMKSYDESLTLAKLLSSIAVQSGINATIFITDMNQPLGHAVGNALEIKESFLTLSGQGPDDLTDLCVELSSGILELAGIAPYEQCREMTRQSLKDGRALNKFRQMVVYQGGTLDDQGCPITDDQAEYAVDVLADDSGYVENVLALEVGMASMILGAGREKYHENIDYAAGIAVHKKIGDYVSKGEAIAKLYTNRKDQITSAKDIIRKAYKISSEAIRKKPLVLKIIRSYKSFEKHNGVET